MKYHFPVSTAFRRSSSTSAISAKLALLFGATLQAAQVDFDTPASFNSNFVENVETGAFGRYPAVSEGLGCPGGLDIIAGGDSTAVLTAESFNPINGTITLSMYIKISAGLNTGTALQLGILGARSHRFNNYDSPSTTEDSFVAVRLQQRGGSGVQTFQLQTSSKTGDSPTMENVNQDMPATLTTGRWYYLQAQFSRTSATDFNVFGTLYESDPSGVLGNVMMGFSNAVVVNRHLAMDAQVYAGFRSYSNTGADTLDNFRSSGGLERASAARPNIIYILADDLGYAALNCYGQDKEKIRTSELDKMAEKGLRFTQHYSGSAVCAPSRCALMTGRHSGHAFIRANTVENKEVDVATPLRLEDLTMGEVMKSAGYKTAIFGKWGLGTPGSTGDPLLHGWDHYYGFATQTNAHEYYPETLWKDGNLVPQEGNANGGTVTYSQDVFAFEAKTFIKANRDRPFFLYLPFQIPHGRGPAPKLQCPTTDPYTDKNWIPSDADANRMHQTYAAMITRMDRQIGEIIKLLEEQGLDKNTLVIFSSDNGNETSYLNGSTFFDASGPLSGKKGSLLEGGIRVPLIVYQPGTVTPAVSSLVCAAWDLLPTFAELAGVKLPARTDGISLVPTFNGKAQAQHDYLYWEHLDERAVRMSDWKAIYNIRSQTLQLFDLARDIGETVNLASVRTDIASLARAAMEEAHQEPATRSNQTIDFPFISDRKLTAGSFNLGASASSDLPVTFIVVSGPATLNGSTLTPTGVGTIVVQARQGGNFYYNRAAHLDRSFKVEAESDQPDKFRG